MPMHGAAVAAMHGRKRGGAGYSPPTPTRTPDSHSGPASISGPNVETIRHVICQELHEFREELMSDLAELLGSVQVGKGTSGHVPAMLRTDMAKEADALKIEAVEENLAKEADALQMEAVETNLAKEADALQIEAVEEVLEDEILGEHDLEAERKGLFHHEVADYADDHMGNLHEEVYRVANFYKETGMAQQVARTERFSNVTLAIIAINALYLGFDAETNDAEILIDSAWYAQACEHFFCCFFTVEIVIRFAAFERKLDCLRDNWFKFDSVLVTLMIFETWILTIVAIVKGGGVTGLPTQPLRLLRLLRLSRLVRLMRSMPELVTMVKGMRVASRAVASSLLMVVLLVYVFAIIMLFICADASKSSKQVHSFFGNLGLCMWTLLIDGTFMDSTGTVMKSLRDLHRWDCWIAVLVFMVFVMLSALTVMNMLIGVLCEVVSAVGQHERDEADIRLVKKSILKELLQFDKDGDGTISKDELTLVMQSKTSLAVLDNLDVDTTSLSELHAMLFKHDSDKVSISSIMESFLAYRGKQCATVKHIVDGQAFIRGFLEQNRGFLTDLKNQMRMSQTAQSRIETGLANLFMGQHTTQERLREAVDAVAEDGTI